MKKLNLQLGSIKEMLTKEQMKKVVGGGSYVGHHCELYCCPDTGSCADQDGNTVPHDCESNEGCQSWAIDNGATCPSGSYVAALCVS